MFGTNGPGHFRVLSNEECERLLQVARAYRSPWRHAWVAMFTILINYGARVSEATALRWQDADFAGGTITIPIFKRWRTLPDGRRERLPVSRTLPLVPPVEEALMRWRPNTAQPGEAIFWMDRRPVYRVFQILLKRAGIHTHHRLHNLRHSAATRLMGETKDLLFVRQWLGHASIASTQVYLHAMNVRETAAKLDWIGKPSDVPGSPMIYVPPAHRREPPPLDAGQAEAGNSQEELAAKVERLERTLAALLAGTGERPKESAPASEPELPSDSLEPVVAQAPDEKRPPNWRSWHYRPRAKILQAAERGDPDALAWLEKQGLKVWRGNGKSIIAPAGA